MSRKTARPEVAKAHRPAIRYLVESALREIVGDQQNSKPKTRADWVVHLTETLMSDSDAAHHAAFAALMSTGVGREEIFRDYIPDVSRYLGDLWVRDRASFVDVTVGAARLQKMFSAARDDVRGNWHGRSIPLGHPVLMVIPRFENHSLGAFVVADRLRRHGVWVHMGVNLDGAELVGMIEASRFSMVGLTLATPNSIEKAAELVDFVRSRTECVPPIVVGGRAVDEMSDAARRVGADHSAGTAREAIEKCGLATIARTSIRDNVC